MVRRILARHCLIALALLGKAETRFALKALVHTYEVVGKNTDTVLEEIDSILEAEQLAMRDVHAASFDGTSRIVFSVEASRTEHDGLLVRLHQSRQFSSIRVLGSAIVE